MVANYDNRDEHRSCRSTAAESSASAFALGGQALQGYAEVGRCKLFHVLVFFPCTCFDEKTLGQQANTNWGHHGVPPSHQGHLLQPCVMASTKLIFLDAAFFAGLPADRIFQAPLESIQQLQSVFRRCFVARHEPRRKKATLVAACVFRSDDEFLGRCLSGWVERACI